MPGQAEQPARRRWQGSEEAYAALGMKEEPYRRRTSTTPLAGLRVRAASERGPGVAAQTVRP